MIEAGGRQRSQPAPPWVIFEALTQPNRDPARPWLLLLDGEQRPSVLTAEAPSLVVWSSLWQERPDATIRFDLPAGSHGGTDLKWTLLLEGPIPDPPQLGHFRTRINELINANLRYSFGQ